MKTYPIVVYAVQQKSGQTGRMDHGQAGPTPHMKISHQENPRVSLTLNVVCILVHAVIVLGEGGGVQSGTYNFHVELN